MNGVLCPVPEMQYVQFINIFLMASMVVYFSTRVKQPVPANCSTVKRAQGCFTPTGQVSALRTVGTKHPRGWS